METLGEAGIFQEKKNRKINEKKKLIYGTNDKSIEDQLACWWPVTERERLPITHNKPTIARIYFQRIFY